MPTQRRLFTIHDFCEEVEEGLNDISRELGFKPEGESLERKILFINEKLSAFGFPQQALEYINGHADLLKKRTRYPDLQRLAARYCQKLWTEDQAARS